MWARNLPEESISRLILKNVKIIELLAEYPLRHFQIILKLPSTRLDILLNFDLDACALAFDGTNIFMLPRCARALETDYNVFIMNLVWGHHLGYRRESRI